MNIGLKGRRAAGIALAVAILALPLLGACAQAAPAMGARVTFVDLEDGAVVSSPLVVKMAAENFTVEPAGEVKAGHGHLHIVVDADCIPAGQVVPKDDTHLHYGQGQVEATLDLASGAHTLCLQAADGAHVALPDAGATQKIAITVQ
jgi:hypothetical protein